MSARQWKQGVRGLFMSLLMVVGSTPDVASAPQADSGAELAALFADEWDTRLRESPLFATTVGDHRFDRELDGESLADHERRAKQTLGFLERLDGIPRKSLSGADQVHYDVFRLVLENRAQEYLFGAHLMPITNRAGFHVSFPETRRYMPLKTVGDFESYLARLKAFPRYAAQHMECMREGIRSGRVLPAIVLEGWEDSIKTHLVDDPRKSLFFEPFNELPPSFGEEDTARLTAEALRTIPEAIVATYQEFYRFMDEEYVSTARESIGASALPDGVAFYAHRVRRFTTLDIDAEAVHEIGLGEVARIRAEMKTIMEEVGFDGDHKAFFAFLRTDDRFYVNTPEALLKEVAYVLKRMDGALPKLFDWLPRMPYGIQPVPDYIAPKTTTAYYERPAGDGSRGGVYFVNTYDLQSRPLYEVPALSLHEAVPGHHLQIALALELEDVPMFRRYTGFTAYVEGWALYAERLGLEVGIYDDPYDNFGRLIYEMWRACRLVVDTGVHALGWSRERAIGFMADNTALSLHNITTEVDRYISWPGQALGYKMGELTIRRLRSRAERALGDTFDLRQFHHVVLEAGAVPLAVLEANVENYIATTLKR